MSKINQSFPFHLLTKLHRSEDISSLMAILYGPDHTIVTDQSLLITTSVLLDTQW